MPFGSSFSRSPFCQALPGLPRLTSSKGLLKLSYMAKRGEEMEKVVYGYTVVFTPEEEGGYSVTVPALPGAISQGDTLEEARENIKEAILGILESHRKHGLPIPVEDQGEAPGQIREKVNVELTT
jgi:antitoxin HicB